MRQWGILLGLILPLCLWVGPATAQLPADQTVELRFHQTPNDSSSSVEWTVIASLQASDGYGNVVGWSVVSLEFYQTTTTGMKSWVDYYPVLVTVDGLRVVVPHPPQSI